MTLEEAQETIRKQAAQIADLTQKAQVQYGELIAGDDRRDAERYRWLRDTASGRDWLNEYNNCRFDGPEDFDAAIDAADAIANSNGPPTPSQP